MTTKETTQREMRWELESGVVLLSFPHVVNLAEIDDLRDLTELWLRGLKRLADCGAPIDGDWAE